MIVIFCSFMIGRNIDSTVETVCGLANIGILRGLAGFSIGVGAYLIFERSYRNLKAPSIILYVLLFALVPFFLIPGWSGTSSIVFYAILLALLVLLAANDGRTVLSSRPMVFLGAISYSIYLLHMPIYMLISTILGDANARGGMKFIVVFPAIFLVSFLSSRYFERPLQRWINSVHRDIHSLAR
jgi:peptidoglycan/LPS O-acetylase OafA/YrhL